MNEKKTLVMGEEVLGAEKGREGWGNLVTEQIFEFEIMGQLRRGKKAAFVKKFMNC